MLKTLVKTAAMIGGGLVLTRGIELAFEVADQVEDWMRDRRLHTREIDRRLANLEREIRGEK